MTGGFLKGALTGTIVAGLIAGTVSVLSDPPERAAPQAGTVEVTPGSGFDARREDREPTLPGAEPRFEAGAPPLVTRPTPDGPGDALPRAGPDTAPATAPMTDGADRLGRAPVFEPLPEAGPEAGSGGLAPQQDGPISSGPPPSMPDAPTPAPATDQPVTDQPMRDPRAEPATPGAATADDTAGIPALRRNAAAFVNRGGKPLMAVMLVEVASSTLTFETLENFPYPLSIALDPDRPGAAEAAARYREAGFEVVLTIDLPQDSAPADTRRALQSRLSKVPQAVAVLNRPATGRSVAGAAPILAQTGHGLVSRQPKDDAARDLLALAGVPAAVLQRDLDGQGQGVDGIEDALDQAAAVADAQRGVIVLGRMRADTLRALSLWSGQGGARRVTLAPVSAVLLSGAPDR